jgi:hypothetical protein
LEHGDLFDAGGNIDPQPTPKNSPFVLEIFSRAEKKIDGETPKLQKRF